MNLSALVLLLQLAVALLISTSANPAATPEQKQQARDVANQAVVLAINTLAQLNSSSSQTSQFSITTIQQSPAAPQVPYFVAYIPNGPSYTETTNDGGSLSIFFIKTELSDGEILANKQVTINGEAYTSDNNGTIIYSINSDLLKSDPCSSGSGTFVITLTDGVKTYSQFIPKSEPPPQHGPPFC